jgi:hypothetical protein
MGVFESNLLPIVQLRNFQATNLKVASECFQKPLIKVSGQNFDFFDCYFLNFEMAITNV